MHDATYRKISTFSVHSVDVFTPVAGCRELPGALWTWEWLRAGMRSLVTRQTVLGSTAVRTLGAGKVQNVCVD